MSENKLTTVAPAIEIQGLSKVFQHSGQSASSLKEMFLQGISTKRNSVADVNALKDINLTIAKGESVGFIGRNGSGKTTLLKLISGVTKQTSGTVETNGRIGTLTDLWAGFHPDLSGMENIFLSASMYNLSRSEVFEILDDIQSFAELGEFIFTPVKNYSSGMLIRLAFSIIVHLNPDILLLDEILACGDSRFQKKATQRILELKKKGVTILFVTHYVSLMERVVDRIVWLDNGEVKMDGPVHTVVRKWFGLDDHQNKLESTGTFNIKDSVIADSQRYGTGEVLIQRVNIKNQNGEEAYRFSDDEKMIFEFEIETFERRDVEFFMSIFRADDGFIGMLARSSRMGLVLKDHIGKAKVEMELEPMLAEGCYDLSVYVAPPHVKEEEVYDLWLRFQKFIVVSNKIENYPPV